MSINICGFQSAVFEKIVRTIIIHLHTKLCSILTIFDKLKDRLDKIHILNSELHNIFTIIHGIYRSAYKTKKDKKDCQEIRDGIKKIIFLKNIEARFKEIAEKI